MNYYMNGLLIKCVSIRWEFYFSTPILIYWQNHVKSKKESIKLMLFYLKYNPNRNHHLPIYPDNVGVQLNKPLIFPNFVQRY